MVTTKSRVARKVSHHAPRDHGKGDLYTASTRRYDGLPQLTYPFHDRDVLITACGRLCLHRKRVNVSSVLAGQRLRIQEVDDGIWLVSFMLLRSRIFRPGAENLATPRQPVRHKVVTHALGTFCYPRLRAGQKIAGGESGIRVAVRRGPGKSRFFIHINILHKRQVQPSPG